MIETLILILTIVLIIVFLQHIVYADVECMDTTSACPSGSQQMAYQSLCDGAGELSRWNATNNVCNSLDYYTRKPTGQTNSYQSLCNDFKLNWDKNASVCCGTPTQITAARNMMI